MSEFPIDVTESAAGLPSTTGAEQAEQSEQNFLQQVSNLTLDAARVIDPITAVPTENLVRNGLETIERLTGAELIEGD
jgi:hypothetical protein